MHTYGEFEISLEPSWQGDSQFRHSCNFHALLHALKGWEVQAIFWADHLGLFSLHPPPKLLSTSIGLENKAKITGKPPDNYSQLSTPIRGKFDQV